MHCNSSRPDIPVILSGTLKFFSSFVGNAFFLVFPFFAFLFCGWLGRFFCSKATLIRSMASSVGTNLQRTWLQKHNSAKLKYVVDHTFSFVYPKIRLFVSFVKRLVSSSMFFHLFVR